MAMDQQQQEQVGPQTFRDAKGRVWEVSINATTVKRAQRLLALNIPGLLNDGQRPLQELLGDNIRLCDLLYVICKREADERGVSDEEFGEGLFGDALFAARDAFMQALRFFFGDRRVRHALGKVIDAAKISEERVLRHLEQETAKIDPQKLGETLAERLLGSLTKPPASSESTPDPSPSTN
jgi:hypothetical protein